MIIEIDGVPPSLNKWARLHWAKQREIKQEWAWLVKAACLAAKVGRPGYKMATVKITLIFPVMRRRDIDNYAPKFLLDPLVGAGIILDDRADWVDVSWHFAKGDKRETIIEVEVHDEHP